MVLPVLIPGSYCEPCTLLTPDLRYHFAFPVAPGSSGQGCPGCAILARSHAWLHSRSQLWHSSCSQGVGTRSLFLCNVTSSAAPRGAAVL